MNITEALKFEFVGNVTPLVCVYKTNDGFITEYADRIESIIKCESNWEDYKDAVKPSYKESVRTFETLYGLGI